MPAVGDILRRFRALGVPGAPWQAGVPVDKKSVVEAELAPVFLALEDAERGARTVLEDGRRQAAAIDERAARESDAILRGAREGAAAARALAVAERTGAAEQRCNALLAEAEAQAQRVDAASADRVRPLADMIVRRVLGGGGE